MAKLKLINDPRNYIFASEVLLNKYPGRIQNKLW